MKAAAAFGVLYLPVPIVDVYIEAGLARLQSAVNGGDPNEITCGIPCGPLLFRLDRTNTSGAEGVGAQHKLCCQPEWLGLSSDLCVVGERESLGSTRPKPVFDLSEVAAAKR
jgi:hypothetical protein